MPTTSREFQIFAKSAGARCNLACDYCYYLEAAQLYTDSYRMPEHILEEYIVQHINATTEPAITFSWHGGEPTLLGLDYFRTIVALQRHHKPANRLIANGIQTNGTLLNDDWCRFFKEENFFVGISIDGPAALHDLHRRSKSGEPTHSHVMRGYELLRKHEVTREILCVVHADNVRHPLAVYNFFRQLEATHISFLPLVMPPDGRSVPAEAFGDFLIAIFDEWQAHDIGKIKVQMFEEAVRPAFGQEHTLCIFKEKCGGVPVIEHNGDFYSCDHYVNDEHRLGNIMETALAELLDSPAQRAFGQRKLDTLPTYCRDCEVRAMCNGGCPKDRFIRTPNGEEELNYLCAGYKRFFLHCLPFVKQIATLWEQQHDDNAILSSTAHSTGHKVGRNEPCPCGSGKKYKNCCLGR